MLINISITSHELHFQIQNSSQVPRKANFKPKEYCFQIINTMGWAALEDTEFYNSMEASQQKLIPLRGLEQVTFHS